MTAESTNLIPGEIFAAFMTHRLQFVDMLEAQIENGTRTLPVEEQRGLIQSVRDLIQERTEDKDQIDRMARLLKELRATAKGVLSHTERLLALAEAKANPREATDEEA